MATPRTIAFHTLGCKLNFSETSAIADQFREQGYGVVDSNEGSDIFVLNTCSVTDFADRKCRKEVRRILKNNPDTRVVVTGCYAQLKPQEIARIPGVDLVLGAGEKFRIVDYVESLGASHADTRVHAGDIDQVNTFVPAVSSTDRTRSFLKVQDGCDYKCSFCTIPLARGRSRSGRLEDILASARRMGAQGNREIVLTGVNIGDYLDLHANGVMRTFHDLIQALEADSNVERFRISSIEPNLCHDEIIDFVAQAVKFMPHFHMPLQSGNDKQLRQMRRRYKRDLYARRVERIRAMMPHACIGVDVIVGFPGETDADFTETCRFVAELDVSYLHVFTYSERPNTPAASMPDAVPMEVRRERSAILRALSDKKRRAFNAEFVGDTREVLLENSRTEGYCEGFTDNYIKVLLPEQGVAPNEVVRVRLESSGKQGYLAGAVISGQMQAAR
jgi:threonylcarbamoyladenosine tRNA methylthiotransferase MtaB